MLRTSLHAITVSLVLCSLGALGQVTAAKPAGPFTTTLPSGIERISGTESSSGIQYVRLILRGGNVTASTSSDMQAAAAPLLIAQCTSRPKGKNLFEVFASFGAASDLNFYPPWKRTNDGELFPPRTEKVNITMEFLGYTHVKPVKRQWEIPVQTPDLYRYNSPSSGSTNMEDITYYLRFLLALPTLHLTLQSRTAEFVTPPWIQQIRSEPLCAASGLK